MVQQSDVLKRFLAGAYSNQILYLNSVSKSETSEDSKNQSPKEWNNCFTRNFTLKSLKIKL